MTRKRLYDAARDVFIDIPDAAEEPPPQRARLAVDILNPSDVSRPPRARLAVDAFAFPDNLRLRRASAARDAFELVDASEERPPPRARVTAAERDNFQLADAADEPLTPRARINPPTRFQLMEALDESFALRARLNVAARSNFALADAADETPPLRARVAPAARRVFELMDASEETPPQRTRTHPGAPPPLRTRPASAAHSVNHLLSPPVTCATCWDDIPDRDRTRYSCRACETAVCSPCLIGYANAALSDRSMLPLRCASSACNEPIPVASAAHLLPARDAARLLRFDRERASSPPEPDADLLELVAARGWARCPACGAGVERVSGCAHMTCACGGEFCYDCGGMWAGGARCPAGCGLFPPLEGVPDPQEPAVEGGLAAVVAMDAEVMRGIADVRARLHEMMAQNAMYREEFRVVPPPVVGLRARIERGRAEGEENADPQTGGNAQGEARRSTLEKMSLQTIVHPEPPVSVLTVSPWSRR